MHSVKKPNKNEQVIEATLGTTYTTLLAITSPHQDPKPPPCSAVVWLGAHLTLPSALHHFRTQRPHRIAVWSKHCLILLNTLKFIPVLPWLGLETHYLCSYDVGHWELLLVMLAMEEWRHWSEGAGNHFWSGAAIKLWNTFMGPKEWIPDTSGGSYSLPSSTSPRPTALRLTTASLMPGCLRQGTTLRMQPPFSPELCGWLGWRPGVSRMTFRVRSLIPIYQQMAALLWLALRPRPATFPSPTVGALFHAEWSFWGV